MELGHSLSHWHMVGLLLLNWGPDVQQWPEMVDEHAKQKRSAVHTRELLLREAGC